MITIVEIVYELYGLKYGQKLKSPTCSPVSTRIQLFFSQCMYTMRECTLHNIQRTRLKTLQSYAARQGSILINALQWTLGNDKYKYSKTVGFGE